jgi:hypothetical protein
MNRSLAALAFLALFASGNCQSTPSWQGEWGTFTDSKTMIGGRISISQCSDKTCRFSIERGSGTGRIATATDADLKLLSPTTATATLPGGDPPDCTLQFTLQTSPKPVISVKASGKSCLSYYGVGTDVTLSGSYPLRSISLYSESHRDECYFDNSPARLAICTSPDLTKLENQWQELAYEYPARPPASKDEKPGDIAEKEHVIILAICDTEPHPAQCLQARFTAEVSAMQALKDTYIVGTTQRGDPTQGGLLAKKIAGRYRYSFKNGDVQGETFRSTDTLTIRPVGAASIELSFYNGHSCSLDGGALFRKDGSFVFDDDSSNKMADEPLCRLAIIPTSKGVIFKDITGGCKLYCGARGTLDGASFTFSQRVESKSAAK